MTLVELKVLETGNNIGFGTIFPKSYNLIGFRTIAMCGCAPKSYILIGFRTISVCGCAPKSYNLFGLERYLCVGGHLNPII